MFIQSIDSEQLQKLEYASFPGKIQVIDSVGAEFNRAVAYLRSQKVIASVHGILQARILEWVVISFSRGSTRLRD